MAWAPVRSFIGVPVRRSEIASGGAADPTDDPSHAGVRFPWQNVQFVCHDPVQPAAAWHELQLSPPATGMS
jgi:hypothetical protein